MRYKYYRKQIAPRLLDKESRDSYTGGLPPEVKEGLYAIARKECKSVSWVLEQLIIDYFGLKKPKYKLPAVKKEEQEKHVDKMTEMGLGKSLIKPYIITARGYDEIAMLKKRGMKKK
jgi:predicted transcriptional regulator